MKPPKFSDTSRFKYPYADLEETKKPGYLARRFQKLRAEQKAAAEQAAKDAAEREAKTVQMRRAGK